MPFLAIGAASVALDALQSLTSSAPSSSSSQPAGIFATSFPDATDSSAAPPANSAAAAAATGKGAPQISSDNISALINAQSLASADFTRALNANNPGSDSSTNQPSSAFGTASSTYNSIDQLIQSTAVPLGFNPFSVSI
ncbi:MAG TPA: hypothetical protein VKT76_04110 [Bradyrhizobium sp.]|nr:hypothetical protein [Bradyrhizobium sp.]